MKNKTLSNLELAAFSEQLAYILSSGISPSEGLTMMMEDSTIAEEKKLFSKILEVLTDTNNLYEALTATECFPSYMLQMIQIGEETGNLDKVFHALSKHYEREEAISSHIRSFLTYPAVMATMMILVIFVLFTKVLPVFKQVFAGLGMEMSGLSGALLSFGTSLGEYSIFFILFFVLLFFLFLYFNNTQSGRTQFKTICYKLGLFRSFYEKIALTRFASGLALTLSAGLDSGRSIELVSGLNEDPYFQKKLDVCIQKIQENGELYEALTTSQVFSGTDARMASIGSVTGKMDEIMEQIADRHQTQSDLYINHTLSILEPTIVIVLSVIVGFILLSVMLPLLGILSSL